MKKTERIIANIYITPAILMIYLFMLFYHWKEMKEIAKLPEGSGLIAERLYGMFKKIQPYVPTLSNLFWLAVLAWFYLYSDTASAKFIRQLVANG